MDFESIAESFRQYHTNSLNVLLHLITTPLGILAVMGLTNTATGSPWVSTCLIGIYALSLIRQLSTGLFLANTIAVAMLMTATVVGPLAHLGPWELVGLVVVAYVGQDLAHWITGEVLTLPYSHHCNSLFPLSHDTLIVL